MLILETTHFEVRPFVPEDLAALCELHFDEAVMRYLVGGVRGTKADVARDLEGYAESQRRDGFSKWAVVDRATKRLAGRAGFVRLSTGEIDFGYALHRVYWGKGYGTEIATALLDWARANLPDLRALVGLVLPANAASARVLEKIGFHPAEDALYFGQTMRVFRFTEK